MGCCGFRPFSLDMTQEEKLIHNFEKDLQFENVCLDGFISSVTLPEMSVKDLQSLYEIHHLHKEDLTNDSKYSPFYQRFCKNGSVSTKYICILAILLSSDFEILKAKLLFSLYNDKHLTLNTMNEILTDLTSVSIWIVLAVPSSVLDRETVDCYYKQLESVQKSFCIRKAKSLMHGKKQMNLEEFMEIFMKSLKTRYILKTSGLRTYMMTRYISTQTPQLLHSIVDLKPTLSRSESTRPSYSKQKSVTFNDQITCYHLQNQQQDEIPPEEHLKRGLKAALAEEPTEFLEEYEIVGNYEMEEDTHDILRYEDIIVITHTSNNSALSHGFSDIDPLIDAVTVNTDRDDTSRWCIKPSIYHETVDSYEEIKYGCRVVLRNLCTKKYLSIENLSSFNEAEYQVNCQEKASENSNWIIEPAYDYGNEMWHPSHDIKFKHVDSGLYLCLTIQELEDSQSECWVQPSEASGENELWYIESKTVD